LTHHNLQEPQHSACTLHNVFHSAKTVTIDAIDELIEGIGQSATAMVDKAQKSAPKRNAPAKVRKTIKKASNDEREDTLQAVV
jgi:hypothetical protein